MAQYDQLTELLDLANVRVVHYQLVGPSRLNLFVESTLEAAVCPGGLTVRRLKRLSSSAWPGWKQAAVEIEAKNGSRTRDLKISPAPA